MKIKMRNLSLKNLTISGIFSLAVGVFLVLLFWQFELRSISRLLLITIPIAALIWALSYFFYFYQSKNSLKVFSFQSGLNLMVSLLTTAHLVPPQVSTVRYLIVLVLALVSLFCINQTALSFFFPACCWKKTLPLLVVLLAASNLAIIIYNAQFVRIYGDDFANVLKLERLGVWGAGMLFYRTWSGRFFSNFLVMGFSNKPWAPLVFLLSTQGVFFYALDKLFKTERRNVSLPISLLSPLVIYSVTPDMYKSIYWNGTAMYLLPLMLMVPIYLLLAYQLGAEHSQMSASLLIISGILSFAITTCQESFAIGWLGLHFTGLIWAVTAKPKQKNLGKFLLAGAFGSVLGLTVMLLSPGVSSRYIAQEYSTSLNIPLLISNTVLFFLRFLRDISRPIYVYHGFIRPGWLLLIGLFGFAWLADSPLKRSHRAAFLVLCLSLSMTLAAFVPGAVILGDTIPYRTQFIPTMFLAFGVFIFGMLLPQPKSQPHKSTISYLLIVVILAGSLINLAQLSRTIAPMRQYARDWDARDELVRTTDALPRRLTVPWDEYEQNLGDFRKYYRSRN